MSHKSIGILQFPEEQLQRLNGFALDFGNSVIKAAYLDKEDVQGDKVTQLRLISFSREDIDEFFKFMKKNCYIRRTSDNERPVVYTCGMGGFQYTKRFDEELGVNAQNGKEMDYHTDALRYFVKNVPLEEFSSQTPQEVTQKCQEEMLEAVKLRATLKDTAIKNKEDEKEIITANHDPTKNIQNNYQLGIMGSGFLCLRLPENGGYSVVNGIPFGGRSFLGLGSLLTGAQTFDELMALAEKGNNLNVDLTLVELASQATDAKEDDEHHTILKMLTRPAFLWGKTVQKNISDFSKEDIARALVYNLCWTLVTTALHGCYITGNRHVFLAGSFVSHPLIQEIVRDEFEINKMRTAQSVPGRDTDYHLHIIKHGSHLAAIGAFLHSLA